MAVTIKKKELTLVSLAKRILDNAEMIKLAKAIEASGYKLTTEPTLLKVENQNAILAQTPLKLSAIEKCLKGDLSYAGKTMLQDHIETFIKKAFNLMPEVTEQVNIAAVYDGTMKAYHENGGTHLVKAIKYYRTQTGASLKEAKDKVEAWIAQLSDIAGGWHVEVSSDTKEAAFAEMYGKQTEIETNKPEVANVTDTAVPLENAEALMQPVTGTSGGSIYNVIALGPDAKVAVRIRTDNDVAIRVWPTTDNGRKACAAAGLDKKNGGHWSLHLHPGEKALVNKSIGAVVFAMNLDWDGIIGDMQTLVGVGK